MNPYQSPVPIEPECRTLVGFLLAATLEAFLFTLGYVGLFAVALLLLIVMPIAIGLAWYQYRKSWSFIDLLVATVMNCMLPYWESMMLEAWGNFLLAWM